MGYWKAGTHEIEITAYGNRYNSFGHIHLPLRYRNCGPGAWRSKSATFRFVGGRGLTCDIASGDAWTDGYAVKPVGVLGVPVIEVSECKEVDEAEIEEEYQREKARRASAEWVKVAREEA